MVASLKISQNLNQNLTEAFEGFSERFLKDFERSDPQNRRNNMNKKAYIKPAQRIVVLQHQSHLLAASGGEERSLRTVSGPFDYGGSDENYDGDVR